MHEGKMSLMVLLDLSAAFDTVDHQFLLNRLELRYGITGNALAWIKAYLHGRGAVVNISGVRSDRISFDCDVPQGSVLGPILFTMYVQPVTDIILQNNLMGHCYADDTLIYFNFRSQDELYTSIDNLMTCIHEIRNWMTENCLKLNEGKLTSS